MNSSIDVVNNQVVVKILPGMKSYAFAAQDGVFVVPMCHKRANKDIIRLFTGMSLSNLHKKKDIVDVYKKAGDILGVSVAMFTKMLNGAITRCYIKPNYDLLSRFAWSGGYGSYNKVDLTIAALVNERAKFINSFLADGNTHLAGFGLIFDNASIAKVVLGKGLWKSLCANSKSRNDIIVHKLVVFGVIESNTKNGIKVFAKMLQSVPSTMLKLNNIDTLFTLYKCDEHIIKRIISYYDRPMYKIEECHISKVVHVIHDCVNMLGDAFNNAWSIKRIFAEHDKAVKIIQAKRYSKDLFQLCDDQPHTIEHKLFTAELVKSAFDLNTLGNEEHHCVGGYSLQCADNQYIVYKITDKEGLVSTLGLATVHGGGMDQHYHACNKPVKDINRLAFAKSIRRKIPIANYHTTFDAPTDIPYNRLAIALADDEVIDI